MSDHLAVEPPAAAESEEQEGLRLRNRSPHPYYHQSGEVPHASHQLSRLHSFSKESTPISDSGTEADDEHILKGLPAPKAKPHKGLRGRNEVLSGASTPLLMSASTVTEKDIRSISGKLPPQAAERRGCSLMDHARGHRNLVRRITEFGIVFVLSLMVVTNRRVAPIASTWKTDLARLGAVCALLAGLYPLRLLRWTYWNRTPSTWLPIKIPSNFDPAPLLYPPSITLLVSFLVSTNNPAFMLPNVILSLSSLPQQLVPKLEPASPYDVVHWAISCLPLVSRSAGLLEAESAAIYLPLEAVTLLYPLHRTTCALLHYLTTTSLLTAELQLLSIALINILVLATSPQMQILKALLWGGGIGILLLCGAVIQWGISLARVPRWRFRRLSASQKRPFWSTLSRALSWRRIRAELRLPHFADGAEETPSSSASDSDSGPFSTPTRVQTLAAPSRPSPRDNQPSSPDVTSLSRRSTLSAPEKVSRSRSTHTASGRKKRSTSLSVRPFLRLTHEQALLTKWTYAAYVYACIVLLILIGIRLYVQRYALHGSEPIGWAVGYLFGDLTWLRFQIVNANLERWICLPSYIDKETAKTSQMGWVEHIRQDDFGQANTRLFLSAYWLCILIFGLLVVFQLKSTYEVDTRRKVFHFMMVGMFLPATYIDPTYAALALCLILAIFLILDLLRASQLPPLSKPLAAFLAPYVDGRDFRGPVVISHIFLLIGCAIPLWLALGSLPRSGAGYLEGWEVPTREVSMVSGVICVGLGDAAASLIGRRYGHRKWLWGGGKSLEGSVAFVCAVFVGLFAASMWLRVGGWPITDEPAGVFAEMRKVGACASMASLTEAVLTGGNDNVIVPVVLWTCAKSLGI